MQHIGSRKAATVNILKRISDALHPESLPLKPHNKENSPVKHQEPFSNYKEQNPVQLQIEVAEFKIDEKDKYYYMNKLAECENALRKKAKKIIELEAESTKAKQEIDNLILQIQKKDVLTNQQRDDIQALRKQIQSLQTNNKKIIQNKELMFCLQTLQNQISDVKKQHQAQINQLLSKLIFSQILNNDLQTKLDFPHTDSQTLLALNNHISHAEHLHQTFQTISPEQFYQGINYILGRQITIFNQIQSSNRTAELTQEIQMREQKIRQSDLQNKNKSLIISNLQQNLEYCQRSLNETANRLLKTQQLLQKSNSAIFSHQIVAANAISQKNAVFEELTLEQERIKNESQCLSLQLQFFLGKYFEAEISHDERDLIRLQTFLFRVFLNKVIETQHLRAFVSPELQSIYQQKNVVLSQIKQYYRHQLQGQIANSLSYFKPSIKRR